MGAACIAALFGRGETEGGEEEQLRARAGARMVQMAIAKIVRA